jgi:hypothetical protein
MSTNSSLRETLSLYRIEPFNGTNWVPWKLKLRLILADLELWDHVDGTSSCLVPSDPAAPTETEAEEIAA